MPRWARWSAYCVIVIGVALAAYAVVRQGQKDDVVGASDPKPAVQAAATSSPSASPTPSSSASATPGTARSSRKVLFVGDAYLAYAASPARASCAELAWRCSFDLRAAGGYVAGPRYSSRLAADRKYRPELVVVAGGRSDVGRTGVAQAARAYLAAVAKQFPKAELVVIEPFWNDDVTYQAVDDVRGDVRAAADRAGATWVPTKNWLTGSDKFLDGGQRLSPAGQSVLTAKLLAALKVAPKK